MRYLVILLTIIACWACNLDNENSIEKDSDIQLQAKIFDEQKADKFNSKYQLVIPLQEFSHLLGMWMGEDGWVDTSFPSQNKSYIIFSDVYGHSQQTFTFPKDTSIQQAFILWFQPLNYIKNRFYYLNNNVLYKADRHLQVIDSFPLSENFSFAPHCIDEANDSSFYYGQFYTNKKWIDRDSATIIDFYFKKLNTISRMSELLYSATDIANDKMLNPELFEDSGGPLYKNLDIYHWNWIQTEGDKMLINYAFSGFQQVDMKSKQADWYWSFSHKSFDTIMGVGDLSSPYYTHHFNKINSGPYKGMYSYFENGSYALEGKKFRPARGRIIDIDTLNNSVRVVWEKVFDFASAALGSIHVFDDYIFINVGLALPLSEIDTSEHKIEFYKSFNRALYYLYDVQGNPISEYFYSPGFYSYLTFPSKRN